MIYLLPCVYCNVPAENVFSVVNGPNEQALKQLLETSECASRRLSGWAASQPSVTQWMCLCFPHCDSTHCELHCCRQLSLILKTGTSLSTVCGWYTDYRGQPVAYGPRQKESLKENNETERQKWHHSDSEISGSSVGPRAGVCLISKAVSFSLCRMLNEEKTHACLNRELHKQPVFTSQKEHGGSWWC